MYDPSNYRGIHLTSVLSKVVEKIVVKPVKNVLEHGFGCHQWAYRAKRSSQDLVTLLICSWIFHVCCGCCVGAYLSDISGAFDRVHSPTLVKKLRNIGVGRRFTNFAESWLQPRSGKVCMEASLFEAVALENQVFQGTVLGPALWNVFFADVVSAAISCGCEGRAFADDFNCFRKFHRNADHDHINAELDRCRETTHEWGRKNRVIFDTTKEAKVVLHPTRGQGETFRLLGLMVDNALRMDTAVDTMLAKARPKCQALLRARSYYHTRDVILQFKTHVLGILECNTGGIYHATSTVLAPLDRLFRTFVHALNLDIDQVFLEFNLAPLGLRRDIAMLGFLHKCNLPGAHEHILELFPRSPHRPRGHHDKQLGSVLTSFAGQIFQVEMWKRSVLYLVHVYNALPQRIVDAPSVCRFQTLLTEVARKLARQRRLGWQTFLSAREWDRQNRVIWKSYFT